MSMITFTTNKESVVIKIETDHEYHILPEFNCSSGLYANLLRAHLSNKLWTAVKEIRRESYERGWKDAKSKKVAKEEYFNGSLN